MQTQATAQIQSYWHPILFKLHKNLCILAQRKPQDQMAPGKSYSPWQGEYHPKPSRSVTTDLQVCQPGCGFLTVSWHHRLPVGDKVVLKGTMSPYSGPIWPPQKTLSFTQVSNGTQHHVTQKVSTTELSSWLRTGGAALLTLG